MNAKSWPQFRTQLFDIIEKRRAIASIFRYEQIHWFISGCRRLFASPATKEVQDELNAIQDEGTFLLVADSLTKFLTMFEEAPDETSQQPTREAAADRDVVRPPLVPHQTTAQKAGAQVSSRTQVSTDARRRSGRPF